MMDIEAIAEVTDAAINLVCLWENQQIEGLFRKQRNKAIEENHQRLVAAVHTLATEKTLRAYVEGARG
jgi:hypothetical protein